MLPFLVTGQIRRHETTPPRIKAAGRPGTRSLHMCNPPPAWLYTSGVAFKQMVPQRSLCINVSFSSEYVQDVWFFSLILQPLQEPRVFAGGRGGLAEGGGG